MAVVGSVAAADSVVAASAGRCRRQLVEQAGIYTGSLSKMVSSIIELDCAANHAWGENG